MENDSVTVEKSPSRWAEIIKSTGSAELFSKLPEEEIQIGDVKVVGRGADYSKFPLFGDVPQNTFLELAHGAEQQVYGPDNSSLLETHTKNRLEFGTEVLSYFSNKWHALPDNKMAISYACSLAKESYPEGENRPGVRLTLRLLVPSKLGRELVDKVLQRPELIEEVFQELCRGLTAKIKRYKTDDLEVIESGKIRMFNPNRLLGKDRKRDIKLPQAIGETNYDPTDFAK